MNEPLAFFCPLFFPARGRTVNCSRAKQPWKTSERVQRHNDDAARSAEDAGDALDTDVAPSWASKSISRMHRWALFALYFRKTG